MKRIKAGLLALAVAAAVLGLTACGGRSAGGDVAGTWQRETIFLAYFACKADLVLELNADGTYEKTTTDHDTGAVLDEEAGTWTLSGTELKCVKAGETATITYQYDSAANTLENAGYLYQKIG